MKKIFSRNYYVGFGDSVSEQYYEENGEFFQSTYVSGYWSGDENIKKITKADIEKVISGTLINFKQRLSALPAEEADKLATMTDKAKILQYLNGKIKKILLELSSFEAVFNEVAEDEEEHD